MKVATIQTNLRNFFYHWINVTQPLHKLGKTEKIILSEMLYYRYKLSLEVTSDKLIDKLLFDYDTKHKICKDINVTLARYDTTLSIFRREKILKGRILNKAYFPEITKEDNEFVFAYRFKINRDEVKKKVYKKAKKNSKR